MKIIGLVGQSGTGKTTIARHLERRGAGHIGADGIVHNVLEHDESVRKAIGASFGQRVLVAGEVDRAALGRVVFSDSDALDTLNGIVHPPVIAAIAERVKHFETAGASLVVIDAALLLEVSLPFHIDLMIALRCDREEQLRRLVADGGRSLSELEARLDSQAHIEQAFERADVIIDTRRPETTILSEVDQIIEMLLGKSTT